jgi:hypothetical protein
LEARNQTRPCRSAVAFFQRSTAASSSSNSPSNPKANRHSTPRGTSLRGSKRLVGIGEFVPAPGHATARRGGENRCQTTPPFFTRLFGGSPLRQRLYRPTQKLVLFVEYQLHVGIPDIKDAIPFVRIRSKFAVVAQWVAILTPQPSDA